ncbi:hypothetical protein HDE_04173 [Halotydeus destructor]|nr:hypothetical protein HDE_04173 [Halotydeus destructor]
MRVSKLHTSICREQDGSLPSLTTQEDVEFIRDALGVADYWTSGLPKVVNFQLKQVWPNNAPVKDIQSIDPICRTFLLRCAILVESSNLQSVLREVKKSVNHVCQRRLETENGLIPGPNAID